MSSAPTGSVLPLAGSLPLRRRAVPLRLRRLPIVVAFAWLTLFALALCALLAPVLAPHDPLLQTLIARNRPPAWLAHGDHRFLLGTDALGRDLLSRALIGARFSLALGVTATVAGTALGLGLGLAAGFFRGATDWLVMLVADAQLATPFLVIAIAVVAAFGRGLGILFVLASISGWMAPARICRASVRSLRETEYVAAARATGASNLRIAGRHVLPNLLPLVLVIGTIDLRRIILFEASLSFLGLGVPPPQPSWGAMINDGRAYLNTAWWISVVPGTALMLTVLAVSLAGDWLRDELDPTLRG